MAVPTWFEHNVSHAQTTQIQIMIDEHGPVAYGVYWLLQEFLAVQKNYRASMRVVPGLIRKFNTTQAVMQAVLLDSGLYSFEGDEFFYSPTLDKKMEKWEEFCAKQAQRAKIGALRREQKMAEQIAQLQLKERLSEEDSSQPHTNKQTDRQKKINESLSSHTGRTKERENFQSFRKRIIAQYAGHQIAQQPPGYLPDAVLSVSSSGYLRVNGKDCSPDDAVRIWEWLYSSPHVIGVVAYSASPSPTTAESFIGREFTTPEEGPSGPVEVRKKIMKIEEIEKNQLSIFFEDEFERRGEIRRLFSLDELEKFLNEHKVAG